MNRDSLGARPATFRCAGYTFSLTGDPAFVAEAARAMHDLRDEAIEPTQNWVVIIDGAFYSLSIDGSITDRGIPRDFALSHLVSRLTRQVLDHEPERLHLHVMSVVVDDAALVAAGRSGAGKSTLCSTLVHLGADYASDEAAAVDPFDLTIRTFPKPIVIKRYSMAAVSAIVDPSTMDVTQPVWALAASSIGSVASAEPHRVGTIVSYRYQVDAATVVTPVHRATLAHELLTDSLDAERFGDQSLNVVARLVASARCLSATGADVSSTSRELMRQHRLPFVPGVVTDVPPTAHDAGPARAAGVQSVVVDGRALVMNATSGLLAELPESVTAWWLLLDGTDLDALVGEAAEATGRPSDEIRSTGQAVIAELEQVDLVQ